MEIEIWKDIKGFEPDDLVECAIYLQALEKFTNIIEKKSKEIEELKKPKYIINFETNEITTLTNDFISKDKIKAKIEECREILYSFEKETELKANIDKFIHKESMNCLLGQISILQSLLEEE